MARIDSSDIDRTLFPGTIEACQQTLGRIFPPAPPPQRKASRKTNHGGATLETVAAELGLTKERVRQLEIKALSKCRLWCDRHGFELDDLLRSPPQDIDRR